jgi:hypothetical protein
MHIYDDEDEIKEKTQLEIFSKRLFNIGLIVTLMWSIIFLIWLLYNFKELDKLDLFNYFKCFIHTTIRKTNFMKIGQNDCIYSNTKGLLDVFKDKFIR